MDIEQRQTGVMILVGFVFFVGGEVNSLVVK